ncbi:MAG: hypothetical protein ACREGI_02300 [Candidatus Levyibacteriota bacterium]
MKLLKQKNMLYVGGAVVVLLIVIVGVFFFVNKKAATPTTPTADDQQQIVPTLSPNDLGLTLSPSRGGKSVTMKITNVNGISAIDYELSYTSQGNIPRGAIGHIDVKPTDTILTQEMVLGTCSDVCHYDTDVTGVKLVLKVTKSDNKLYSVEQDLTEPLQ